MMFVDRPDNRGWLRTYRPRPEATIRLFCFPHGGGAAAFFRDWAGHLPAGIEVVSIQYPGRQDRAGEPAIVDMPAMARTVAAALGPSLDRPFAFFGHSMGAAIAWEVAHVLRRRHSLSPALLAVSGRPAPQHHEQGAKHLQPDQVLWNDLRQLGGTADMLLDSDVVRQAVLPALRADYQLIETHRPTLDPPLGCRLLALTGDRDPEAPVTTVAGWQHCTTGRFTLRCYPGDHFYLVPRRPNVIAEVTRHLTADLAEDLAEDLPEDLPEDLAGDLAADLNRGLAADRPDGRAGPAPGRTGLTGQPRV